MNCKCLIFLKISFTLKGQLVWVQKCLRTLCQKKCCRSKMLLMRSIELKKSTGCSNIVDNKSKFLGFESLCIKFMGFFLCWTKVAPRSMCKQCKSWGEWFVILLIISKSSHSSTKFQKGFYLTTLNMVSFPWRNMLLVNMAQYCWSTWHIGMP
jgi:hypothetical protein